MGKKDRLIVVTGGAGFLGSCLVRRLNELGYKNLVIVDELGQDERWQNLVGKTFQEFVHKDDFFEWLKGKEKKIRAIFHLGACSSTVETDADYLMRNNTQYSIRLAQYALDHDIRFIYASSAATYGDGSQGFSDGHSDLQKLRPLNMYGYSKHLVDLWLQEQGALDKVVGLKYFNIFGPNEYHKGRMSSALLKMVPDALQRGKISLFKSNTPEYGDGDQVRDFLYVKDAVDMTAQFLDNSLGGIFNVGIGKPHTWNHLARSVIKALDRPVEIVYMEMPVDLQGKYQNYTCADMKKSEKMKLLKPERSIEGAVIDYVRNYLLPRHYW